MKIKPILILSVLICVNVYADESDNTKNEASQLSQADLHKLEKLFVAPQKADSTNSHNKSDPFPQITAKTTIDNEVNEINESKPVLQSGNDLAVTLIRYAWQQLFAPVRLLTNKDNITRTPMHTHYFVQNLIYGDKVYSHPIASWEMNNTYVTAVEIRNKYPHESVIHLNHDICGNWLSSSIYPTQYLKSAEDEKNKNKDSAVLFLLSEKSFNESMEVCNGLS
jgi:hypothetical protein